MPAFEDASERGPGVGADVAWESHVGVAGRLLVAGLAVVVLPAVLQILDRWGQASQGAEVAAPQAQPRVPQ